MDGSNRFLVVARAVEVGHAHAAQAQARYLKAAFSQCSCFHEVWRVWKDKDLEGRKKIFAEWFPDQMGSSDATERISSGVNDLASATPRDAKRKSKTEFVPDGATDHGSKHGGISGGLIQKSEETLSFRRIR